MAVCQLETIPSTVTMTSLQARLLGVHYLLNHSRMHEAWTSFGIVVRYAQALGLHRASHGPISDHLLHEYRKRVFAAVYINDRLLSGVFGRPCALHDDDVDQQEPSHANEEDITISACILTSGEDFCSAAALVQYGRLAKILGRVLRKLYGPLAKQNTMDHLLEVAKKLGNDLKQWQDGLPAYLDYVHLPSSAMSVMTQRQMCTLKMTFAHACLLLYRPFLVFSISSTRKPSPDVEQWIETCHRESIRAAKTVVAECQDLYERGLFTRAFWLVNYVQFAAIGTLYIYAHIWPESGHIRVLAERAMAQYPIGIEGDMVGQQYYNVLRELRDIIMTSVNAPLEVLPSSAQMISPVDFEFDPSGAWANLFLDTTAMSEQFFEAGIL